jgi:hypothetical protein
MLIKSSAALIFCAVAISVPTLAFADDQHPTAESTGAMTSNGSSTGVGNAGSFGIASGTANGTGTATATATSNGMTDNSTGNRSDSSTTIAPVATQDLEASISNAKITFTGYLSSGSNELSPKSLSNNSGVITIGWNTGQATNFQAGTNLSVNATIGQK